MSAQHEFHGDFDDYIDGFTQSARGHELPLPDRLDRTFVEASAQSATDGDFAHGAVAVDDDFEEDVASDAAPAGVVGVLRLDLAKEARRRDTASGAIGSAADSTSGTWSNARTYAFAVAGAATGSRATVHTGAKTGGLTADLLDHAVMSLPICGRYDRRNKSPGWKRVLDDRSRNWDGGWSGASHFKLPRSDRSFVG
jgi:hypothetical protein